MMNAKLAKKIALAVLDDGEECDVATVQRLFESLDDEGQEWLAKASSEDVFEWAFSALVNTQPPIES